MPTPWPAAMRWTPYLTTQPFRSRGTGRLVHNIINARFRHIPDGQIFHMDTRIVPLRSLQRANAKGSNPRSSRHPTSTIDAQIGHAGSGLKVIPSTRVSRSTPDWRDADRRGNHAPGLFACAHPTAG